MGIRGSWRSGPSEKGKGAGGFGYIAAALAIAAVLAVPRPARAACARSADPHEPLVVGFENSAPIAYSDSTGRATGLAVEILSKLAESNGWPAPTFVALTHTSLISRIHACQLDVGITADPISSQLQSLVDYSIPYLDTVATVAVAGADAEKAHSHRLVGHFGRMAKALATGALCVVFLTLMVILLNLRVIWQRDAEPRFAVVHVDPLVSGTASAARWLIGSKMGRVLVACWFFGGALATIAWSPAPTLDGLVDDGAEYRLALRALSDGFSADDSNAGTTQAPAASVGPASTPVAAASASAAPAPARSEPSAPSSAEEPSQAHVVGIRREGGNIVPCENANVCLRSLAVGTLAAVAGTREILCFAKTALGMTEMQVPGAAGASDIALGDDPVVPERYAFLLPPESPRRRDIDAALLRATKEASAGALQSIYERYAIDRPWDDRPYECDPRAVP